jgi:hypothetical protein
MVGFPTFELPNLPPHRVLSPFNEVPEELGGTGCQVPVDGIMEQCSFVTANNTEIVIKHGNKTDRLKSREILPGVISYSLSYYVQSGDSVVEVPDGREDEPMSVDTRMVTVSFTVSWDFANLNTRSSGSPSSQVSSKFPKDLRDRLVDRQRNCSEFLTKFFGALSKFGKLYSSDLGELFDRVGLANFLISDEYIRKHGSSSVTRGMARIKNGQGFVYSIQLFPGNDPQNPEGNIQA